MVMGSRERAAWASVTIALLVMLGTAALDRERFVVRLAIMEKTMVGVEQALNKLVDMQTSYTNLETKVAVMEERLRQLYEGHAP
jgi:hypothetical protein